MSDLLDDKGQLLLAPGDLFDKMCILVLKHQHINDPHNVIIDEIERLTQLLTNLNDVCPPPCGEKHVHNLMAKLMRLNAKQWVLEDRVRTEDSWEAARAARENNTERVQVKNEINLLFGYPVEKKQYKTKEKLENGQETTPESSQES